VTRTCRLAVLPALLACALPSLARSQTIIVRETAGIRRTQFPVVARVPLVRGALADPGRARLKVGETETPAQFSAAARWEDGSVRSLNVIFNVSVGPGESQTYRLEHGAGVGPGTPARGMIVTEDADSIQAGSLRFSKRAGPLVASANYRGEFVGRGGNGLRVVDNAGVVHEAGLQGPRHVELVERGPLLASIRYDYTIPVDAAYSADATIAIETPSSKSWLKASVAVDDPARRLREIVFELPLAFAAHPWTWDIGTPNGTYGALRSPTDAATFTYTTPARGAATWRVENGTKGELRPYEVSVGARSVPVTGWVHIQDATKAVAFAVEDFGKSPGTYAITLDGQGQTAFRFSPLQPTTAHRLTVYAHFVATPIPIGAATSPASILAPLTVEITN
jgi:hypothetical protein